MNSYLPSRKVIAAALLAVVGTVFLIASGHADLQTLGAVWAPVAAAYGIAEKK